MPGSATLSTSTWEDHFLDKYIQASKSRSASPSPRERSSSSFSRSSGGSGEWPRKASEPKPAAPTSSPKGK